MPKLRRVPRAHALAALVALLVCAPSARSQEAAEDPGRVGQFFTIRLPVTDRKIEELKGQVRPFLNRSLEAKVEPVLIFEFLPGEEASTPTSFFDAAELAEFLAQSLNRAELTIAYLPEPVAGYGLLAALACDEIVLGSEAAIGPIAPAGASPPSGSQDTLRNLALRKGRDPNLLLGMLQPDRRLLQVRTADRNVRFVFEDELPAFREQNEVLAADPAWDAGRLGVLPADRARDLRFTRLLAEDRRAVARQFGLASATDDPLLGAEPNPLLLKIEGPIDTVEQAYIKNRLGRAIGRDGVNLLIIHLDSEGGLAEPAAEIARSLSVLSRQGVKTVAYVDRALGVAALVALGCDEIILDEEGTLGDVTMMIENRGDPRPIADERTVKLLTDEIRDRAREKYHPEWVAAALVDPKFELVRARDHKTEAGIVFVSRDLADADPERFEVLGRVKPVGEVLKLDAASAQELGLARGTAASLGDFLKSRGLENVRQDRPTWVDALVTTLNTPWMSWLLLFIGMFMLILELKLPGVGLPAICSALAFLLFFWGHYLGGTADRLEIMLFLVGLICIALELFVFPGFGVFGVSGILLVLVSVVMASHTFVWPTQEYEYRQMGRTLIQVTLTIVGVMVGAVILGRYFPSLPVFRRMILVPEPAGGPDYDSGKVLTPDHDSTLFYLVGETGRTTTVCRPSGKARIGDLMVDVTAESFYIEADSRVEVVEVHGPRVIVKKIG